MKSTPEVNSQYPHADVAFGFSSLPPARVRKSFAYVWHVDPGGGLKYAASWGRQFTGVLSRAADRTPPIQ